MLDGLTLAFAKHFASSAAWLLHVAYLVESARTTAILIVLDLAISKFTLPRASSKNSGLFYYYLFNARNSFLGLSEQHVCRSL